MRGRHGTCPAPPGPRRIMLVLLHSWTQPGGGPTGGVQQNERYRSRIQVLLILITTRAASATGGRVSDPPRADVAGRASGLFTLDQVIKRAAI